MDENDNFKEPASSLDLLKPSGDRAVAVAIKGNVDDPDSLPQIIASGRGKLAEQILELAFRKGIRVREDADLAQLLAKLDLDTPIPSEAIIAVAEILAKVYEANGRMSPEIRSQSHE